MATSMVSCIVQRMLGVFGFLGSDAMRGVEILLLAVLWAGCPGEIHAALTADQVERLVAALCKEPPDSMDITFYRTVWDLSRDRQDFRRIYEEAFTELYGPEEDLTPAMAKRRERMIQRNVESCLKEQDMGKKFKIRIRYREGRHRIDHVRGSPAMTIFRGTDEERFTPGKKLDSSTDFTTSEIRITDPNNVTRLCTYIHNAKTVSMRTSSGRQARPLDEVTRFAMMPSGPADIVRIKLFDQVSGGMGKPDPLKMEQLQKGTLAGLDIAVDEDTTNPAATVRLRIVWGTAIAPALEMLLVCDREDYARVYSYEARTVHEVLLWEETRSDFDSKGFPHSVTTVQYDDAGNMLRRESYQVEAVHLNVPIPTEAFEVDPKGEYREMGSQPSPEEQRADRITRCKEWLRAENRMQRIMALAELQKLLKDDAVELRTIAGSVQDDPDKEVRRLAGYILERLDKDK